MRKITQEDFKDPGFGDKWHYDPVRFPWRQLTWCVITQILVLRICPVHWEVAVLWELAGLSIMPLAISLWEVQTVRHNHRMMEE
jgi:hypothetical protein